MRIVQKFGGTSVADITRIQAAAKRIQHALGQGQEVIVVVSAMAGVTNQLINLTQAATHGSNLHSSAAHDVVLSAGEQVSCGLLALILNQMGIPAQALLAWQIPINTDDEAGNARILNVGREVIEKLLSQGITPVVAGYQGISRAGCLTTLGRGGSDTTAVALAAYLKAARCDIYTDVDGVYTADPRIVEKAQHLPQVSYDEMLALAAQGAKVLQARSVEMAMAYEVDVRVLSSFSPIGEEMGTAIVSSKKMSNESGIRGLALALGQSEVSVKGLCERALLSFLQHCEKENIPLESLVQIQEAPGVFVVHLMLPHLLAQKVCFLLESLRTVLKYKEFTSNDGWAKLSVVGRDLAAEKHTIEEALKELKMRGILPSRIITTPLTISINIKSSIAQEAMKIMHTCLGLDQEEEEWKVDQSYKSCGRVGVLS